MLIARNIAFALNGHQILNGVELVLEPGQITSMIGPNGAGKSTLLKILTGEWIPEQGDVTLAGRALSDYLPFELSKKRSVVPQSSSLSFDFLVSEVVRMGVLPDAVGVGPELVVQALDDVGLSAKSSQAYTSLSGGEKQRTHIARALVQIRSFPDEGERFLLLDEPTSSLDLVYTQRLMKLVSRLAGEGVGIYMIMHDVNLASAWSDQVLILSGGTLLANGTPEAVITPEILGAAFDVESKIMPHPQSGRPLVLPVVPDDRS